jgi:D-aspartate ligase
MLELTEDLVDKQRFHSLADRLGLPVPETVLFSGRDRILSKPTDLAYPVIAKPLTRKVAEWSPVAGLSKAVSIEHEGGTARLWHDPWLRRTSIFLHRK